MAVMSARPSSSVSGLPAYVPDAWRAALAEGPWHDWRWQHGARLVGVDAVLDALGGAAVFDAGVIQGMRRAGAEFPVSVTPYYLALANPADSRDPILPQVLPDPDEAVADGSLDPFAEQDKMVAPGLVHRYPDRALFLLTNYCSTLCRHCMRKREWQRPFTRLSDAEVDDAVTAIVARPSIRDVLLSGGDPFNLPPRYLGRVLRRLRDSTDLDCLRFGSRVPVTMPQRIDDELLDELAPAAPLFLNTHFNHAREVTAAAVAAVRRLTQVGVVVSNQGVLLRGVNDTDEDLLALCRALLRAGVRAYYLHHCDPVQGARHFRVGLARGRGLVQSLAGQVSGLAIPRFVVDLPGGAGKVSADGPELLRVEGDLHVYRSPLTGAEVGVDGSEGTFGGVGSWLVERPQRARYAAAPSTPERSSPRRRGTDARSSNW